MAAYRVEVELSQRRVRGPGDGDQQVVDGRGQRVEEPPEPVEVGGVEGGDAGPELEAGAVQAVRVAGGEDDACSLGAGEPGCLEPDAGTADPGRNPGAGAGADPLSDWANTTRLAAVSCPATEPVG